MPEGGQIGQVGRRGFVTSVIGVVGGLLTLGYAFVAERFMLPPSEAASTWQSVGQSSDFATNEGKLVVYYGDSGFPDGVYIVRLAAGLVAYDEHCAHLQCPVQWVGSGSAGSSAVAFACPCHGSSYNIYGEVVGGPAPHALNYHHIKEESGTVSVGGIVPWGTTQWNAIAQSLGVKTA